MLIGDTGGAGEAVLVKQGDKTLLRARVNDDAERGETQVTVEHLHDGTVTRVLRQTERYDPFTGLNRTEEGRGAVSLATTFQMECGPLTWCIPGHGKCL